MYINCLQHTARLAASELTQPGTGLVYKQIAETVTNGGFRQILQIATA